VLLADSFDFCIQDLYIKIQKEKRLLLQPFFFFNRLSSHAIVQADFFTDFGRESMGIRSANSDSIFLLFLIFRHVCFFFYNFKNEALLFAVQKIAILF